MDEVIGSEEDLITAHLLVAADLAEDLQRTRIATDNRIRAIKQYKAGSTQQLEAMSVAIKKLEVQATREIEKAMKNHKLGDWVARTPGIGYNTVGKLLAVIGEPSDRKTVGQLWAYCGLDVRDGVAPRHKKGVQGNWNDRARVILYTMAEVIVKNKKSYYRPVYDKARVKYGTAVHGVECLMCGPKGQPAVVDSRLGLSHQHKRAMRLVMKAIVRDIWIESKLVDGQEAERVAA